MTKLAGQLDQRPYVGPGAGGAETFDRLFAEAAPLVRQGLHQRETPPVEGGRWPVSIVLRPDHPSAKRLERVMTEVESYAGSGHFRTGIAGSVHFTVRVLERYRETAGEQDEAVRRYAEAMRRAARNVESIGLDLVGLTLTPGSVMVCAHPVDENGNCLMDLHLGRAMMDTAELVRFRYEDGPSGRLMRPEVLASIRTGSSGQSHPGQSAADPL